MNAAHDQTHIPAHVVTFARQQAVSQPNMNAPKVMVSVQRSIVAEVCSGIALLALILIAGFVAFSPELAPHVVALIGLIPLLGLAAASVVDRSRFNDAVQHADEASMQHAQPLIVDYPIHIGPGYVTVT